jgi:integrase
MSRTPKGFITEKNGKTYVRITYTDARSGKRRELMRRASDKKEARDILKNLRDELSRSNREQHIEGSRLTFGKLADIYQERKLIAPQYVGERKVAGLRSWKVLRGYLVPLREHFGRMKIASITPHHLEQYRLMRLATPKQRGGKQRTITNVNREMELARPLFVYAKREGWLEVNPFDRGERLISKADEVKRTRVLNIDEERLLVKACGTTEYRRRLLPLLYCALDTGMRRGEVLSLRWSNVFIPSRIIVIPARHTKTLKERTVPISERLAREFERMRQERKDDADDALIFSVVDIRKSFKKACADAGIIGLKWHDLRASAGSRLITNGLSIEETAKILGHTVLGTTYAHYLRIESTTINKAAHIMNTLNESAAPHPTEHTE